MSRCPNNVRHWFTVYRMVGVRAPKCQRCGAPNPRPLVLIPFTQHNATHLS